MSNNTFNSILEEEIKNNSSKEEKKTDLINKNSDDEEIINQTYKLFILDENGDIGKIIIFCKNSDLHNESKSKQYLIEYYESFRHSSSPQIKENVDIQFALLQIHLDDSINTIKRKIIYEIGENSICYEEIYLFYFFNEHAHPIGKEFHNPPIIEKTHSFFEANPFQLKTKEIQQIKSNIISVENKLLLNYKNNKHNILFLCLAENILKFEKDENEMELMIEYYYPFLYNHGGIKNIQEFNQEKQNLLEKNKNLVDEKTILHYNAVSFFYDVYKNRKSDLSYIGNGIKEFKITIDLN